MFFRVFVLLFSVALFVVVGCGCGDESSEFGSPVLEEHAPVDVVEGERITFSPSATHPDGEPVTFRFSGYSTLPSRIAGVPGSFTVTIVAEDPHGNSDEVDVPVTVLAATSGARPAYEAQPSSPEAVPFPSDAFTVADANQYTGLRVELPLPPSSEVSARAQVEAINELDGFSPRPRIVVPVAGELPDAATLSADTLFLVGVAPAAVRGERVGLDQVILDEASGPGGQHRILATPQRTLHEASTYALVVTTGITAGAEPLGRVGAFGERLYAYETGALAEGDAYEQRLAEALDATILDGEHATLDEIAVLVPFTTRTVHTLAVRLRELQTQGVVPINEPTFDLDPLRSGREVWNAADVDFVDMYQHRGSTTYDGSGNVSYPAFTLNLFSPAGADDPDEVYLLHVSSGTTTQVPSSDVGPLGGVPSTSTAGLGASTGDEIALMARSRVFDALNPPLYFAGYVGHVGFFRVSAPQFTNATGRIPLPASGSGAAPPVTFTEEIVGLIILPATAKPSEGYPLANYAHGGGGSGFERGSFVIGSQLAREGIAQISFNGGGHGGGPHSWIEVEANGGADQARIEQVGRSRDLNNDGRYGTSEGIHIAQRGSDIGLVLRSFQEAQTGAGGADVTGDTTADVTNEPADTFQFGISYGGQTTLYVATYEPAAGICFANVAGTGLFATGYLTALGASRDRGRELLAMWQPASLLNGDHPQWQGGYHEDVPWPGAAVQLGMVAGAEEIQVALDRDQWIHAHLLIQCYAPNLKQGAHRGGTPATLHSQIVRGDSLATNTLQYQIVRAANLEEQTTCIRLDNEPAWDNFFSALNVDPLVARHVIMGFPHTGNPNFIPGELADDTREQMVRFFTSRGQTLHDPDPSGNKYADNVFEVPITPATLDEIRDDPGF